MSHKLPYTHLNFSSILTQPEKRALQYARSSDIREIYRPLELVRGPKQFLRPISGGLFTARHYPIRSVPQQKLLPAPRIVPCATHVNNSPNKHKNETCIESLYISAGIDTYSLLSFTVQFVSAASVWVLMKLMDLAAFSGIKAIISSKPISAIKQKSRSLQITYKLHHCPIGAPCSLLYFVIA